MDNKEKSWCRVAVQVIAHRGASKYAPENTLPAFQLAYDLKADGIEFDVHLTKDRIPIIIHDEEIGRTTNGQGYVRDYTYRELKELDAGSWFSDEFTGTKILSLQELLEWLDSKSLFLNIELKNNKYDYPQLELLTYELIADYQMIERTCFSTFNPESVKRLRAIDSKAEIAYLTSKSRPDLVSFTKQLGANAVHLHKRLVKRNLVRQAQEENLIVRVYTVNKPLSLIRYSRFCQVNGIITDVPDLAKTYAGRLKWK